MRLALPRPSALALGRVLAAATFLGGCGDGDGADVREIGAEGGSATGSASGSASGVASGSASGSSSAVAATEAECRPAGEDLEGDAVETVDVELIDYGFDPADIEVPAGVVTFATANAGEEPHELAFLPGGGEGAFTDDGPPGEQALAAIAAVANEANGPGPARNAPL